MNFEVGRSRRGSLNHLRLTVSNIRRARAFYDPLMEFLGYRLVESNDVRLAWAGPAATGVLQWFIVSAGDEHGRRRGHDRGVPGLHHVAWNVDRRTDVDACHRLLVGRGVRILDPPQEYDYEPGYYAVFFSDPDGMKLEVVHVPEEGSRRYWSLASRSR